MDNFENKANPAAPELPKEELDIPLVKEKSSKDSLNKSVVDTVERDKQRREKRYFSAFYLIIGCLALLGMVYIIEVIDYGIIKKDVPKSTDSIIEIVKTLLFTLSGYLFARKENDSD